MKLDVMMFRMFVGFDMIHAMINYQNNKLKGPRITVPLSLKQSWKPLENCMSPRLVFVKRAIMCWLP